MTRRLATISETTKAERSACHDFDRRIDRAVVLAAGRGRRMGRHTDALPKPLVPVRGRPLIFGLLDGLAAAGLHHIELITGYLADRLESQVRGHVKARKSEHTPLEVRFHRQGDRLGTASALLACRGSCAGSPFLLTWGDVIASSADYRSLVATFEGGTWDHVLGINQVDDPTDGAAVTLRPDGSVASVIEKPPPGSSRTRWNNAGLFAFGPEIFDYAAVVRPSSRGEYELPDAFGYMLEDGRRIGACQIAGWRHIGTPEELERAEQTGPTGP